MQINKLSIAPSVKDQLIQKFQKEEEGMAECKNRVSEFLRLGNDSSAEYLACLVRKYYEEGSLKTRATVELYWTRAEEMGCVHRIADIFKLNKSWLGWSAQKGEYLSNGSKIELEIDTIFFSRVGYSHEFHITHDISPWRYELQQMWGKELDLLGTGEIDELDGRLTAFRQAAREVREETEVRAKDLVEHATNYRGRLERMSFLQIKHLNPYKRSFQEQSFVAEAKGAQLIFLEALVLRALGLKRSWFGFVAEENRQLEDHTDLSTTVQKTNNRVKITIRRDFSWIIKKERDEAAKMAAQEINKR